MTSRPSLPAPPLSPRRPTAIGAALRAAARFDRSAVSLSAGLIAAIPLTAVFGAAVAAGDPVAAATMGAGAMLVGVAWRVTGGRAPVALLSVDALLMALATFLGSASGSRPWLHLAVVFAWSLAVGLLVAVGRRGAVVGTQAVIGIVVFGRFDQPIPAALGVASLVLAGGLAMVVFVALVRWPSPLRFQRGAVAEAYRALARLAVAASDASTLPAAQLLDAARAALSSPTLFGDAAALALRGLVDEGARLRIELRAIHVLLEQGVDPQERLRVRELLELSAEALGTMAAAVEGDRRAGEGLDEICSRIAALERAVGERASARRHMGRRLAALGGQLRATARLSAAAGQSGRLLERRPHLAGLSPREELRAGLAMVRANATLESPAGRHALRLATVVLVTEMLSRHVPLQRSYWMVVAAATVLRPEFAATFTRGAERMLGTCVGVALAGLIAVGLHPSLGAAVAIVGSLGWLAYSVFPASFAVGFAFVTALVVFLLDAVSADTLATASDRLLDTLVGGSIGLLAYLLWPTWSNRPARRALADLVEAQRAYFAAVIAAIGAGRRAQQGELAPLARRARLAYTTAQETVARSLAEPQTRRIDAEQSRGVLAALRRLISAVHVLRADVQDERDHAPMPELAPLATDIGQALRMVASELPRIDGLPSRDALPALPRLRESYMALESADGFQRGDPLLARQLDEIVDAVNSLAVLVRPRAG